MLRNIIIVLSLALLASCTTANLVLLTSMTNGASIVGTGYEPERYLASYRLESKGVPVTPHVVVDKGRLALLEMSPETGRGFLIYRHWQSDQHDHFALWVTDGPAAEYILPRDRTQAGERYSYDPGSYRIETIDGIERPVPLGAKTVEYRVLPIKR